MNTLESSAQEALTESEKQVIEFNQLRLRLLVGLIALFLPLLTVAFSSTRLTSISGSYYTESRDIYVGSVCIIGALLLAFTIPPQKQLSEQDESSARKKVRAVMRVPKRKEQVVLSIVGFVAAIIAALVPTACEDCGVTPLSVLHYIAAVILFLMIAYICLYLFKDNANFKAKDKKAKEGIEGKKQKRRARFYRACGVGIFICLGSALVAQITLTPETRSALAVTFWVETISLWLFSLAWLIASRFIPWFTDPEERPTSVPPTPQEQGAQAGA